MTIYRFPYGWGSIETKRVQPGIISHAVVADRALPNKAVEVEWCGSFAIAVREMNRQRRVMWGDAASWPDGLPSVTMHAVEELGT